MMYAKTMEGLVGAKTNMDLVNTPMRVYKDARRRGDLAVMERAMGYAGEFAGKAQEYQEKAEEGMEEEAEIAREAEKLEREEAAAERAEEREEAEGESKGKAQAKAEARAKATLAGADTAEVSGEGKALLQGSVGMGLTKPLAVNQKSAPQAAAYTKSGAAIQDVQAASISITV